MANFSDSEQRHLTEFFQANVDIAISLAKVVTRSTLKATNLEDAIDIILQHSTSVQSILSRRNITKEVLYSYLHKHRVSITSDFTKATLIDLLLDFWRIQDNESSIAVADQLQPIHPQDCLSTDNRPIAIVQNIHINYSQINTTIIQQNFRINEFAREFASWFFGHLNGGTFETSHFWSDANAVVRLADAQNCQVCDESAEPAVEVVNTLNSLIQRHNVICRPTESHEGIQGRINPDGLPLVLTCGVLQSGVNVVGIFESVLAVVKEPTTGSYLIKTVRMQWTNGNRVKTPALTECESIAPLLMLDVTGQEVL